MEARTNIFLIILFVFLDQLSKYIVRHTGGFYICNKNIAFGINLPEYVFWTFWLAIIFFIFFSLYKKHFATMLPVIFILSGAIANIVDRINFGCVFDFIDLKFWPLFNLADSFIVLGAIILIIKYIKK